MDFIDVICIRVIGERVMSYLSIKDIISMMQTCKTLNNHLNSKQIWHSLRRIHFVNSPKDLYKQSYKEQYMCKHDTYVGHEWFSCANSPVHTITACEMCLLKAKICQSCVHRENMVRILCDECEIYYIVCDTCDILYQDEIDDFMRVCHHCEQTLCIMHYVNDMECCTDCLIKHPELVGYEQLIEELGVDIMDTIEISSDESYASMDTSTTSLSGDSEDLPEYY